MTDTTTPPPKSRKIMLSKTIGLPAVSNPAQATDTTRVPTKSRKIMLTKRLGYPAVSDLAQSQPRKQDAYTGSDNEQTGTTDTRDNHQAQVVQKLGTKD